MKRFVVSLLFVCSFFPFLLSGKNISAFFITMPKELAIFLDESKKRDLIDLYNDKQVAVVGNYMQGVSELKTLTDDYFFLQATESSSLEAKLLPVNDTTQIICLITTVYVLTPDSRVDFYTTDWKKISSSGYLKSLVQSDFIVKTSEGKEDTLYPYHDAFFVRYSLSPESTRLKAELTTLEYLSPIESVREEEYNGIKIKSLVSDWKDGYKKFTEQVAGS